MNNEIDVKKLDRLKFHILKIEKDFLNDRSKSNPDIVNQIRKKIEEEVDRKY